jgi:hypothetical protein
MGLYVHQCLVEFSNNERYGGEQKMKTTEFTLMNYDGCQWWKTTISVSGLENIVMYLKIDNFNSQHYEFLHHLESIGAIQLTETNEIIHP